MKKTINIFILVAFALILNAENPVVPYFGMADPHCYIFNNKAYLFTTRDADSTAKQFTMPDWQIWSSNDLVDWKLERYIYPTETWMGESNRCWATETTYKNGKYYFYFSNGSTNTGVLVADQPEGPYKDVLGKPMLDVDLTPTNEYDPSVLIDDDGKAYIIFGHHAIGKEQYSWYIARLNDDMISLAEKPKAISVEKAEINKVLRGNDKPNLHKRNGIYYLSAGSHYAMSSNVYGPYTATGNSGDGSYGLTGKAHGNYFTWNNQWFHTWCHFHLGKEVARYRESYMSYMHYKDDGQMVTDVDYLDAHFATGVGQYDAAWDKIQAEWYMKAEGLEKKESPNGGFELQNIQNGASVTYPNVKDLDQQKSISLHVASKKGCTIEFRANTKTGNLLGRIEVESTGGVNSYKDISCPLTVPNEIEDICILFVGEGDDLLRLDYFSFNK